MLFQLDFVRASDIELLDRVLDILHASALLLFKRASLFFESLGTRSSVSLELLLMILVDAELGKFEITLLVLPQQRHLLRLSLELSLVLFRESLLVLL